MILPRIKHISIYLPKGVGFLQTEIMCSVYFVVSYNAMLLMSGTRGNGNSAHTGLFIMEPRSKIKPYHRI